MDYITFNYIESVIWFLFAIVMGISACKAGKDGTYFNTLAVSAVAFLLFGVSDIIEVHTGAWWRPVGLLALKVACVVALAGCYLNYRRLRRRST